MEGLLARYGRLTFIATPGMLRLLGEIKEYRGLLRLWGIDPRYASLVARFIRRTKLIEKVKPVAVEDLPEYEIWGSLVRSIVKSGITEKGLLSEFVADEMCLALSGYPIFCTSSSQWRIVQFFEKVGAKVRRTIHARLEEKGKMLRTRNFRLMALAMGINAAFVYVFRGSLDALLALGSGVITLVIVDG
jgi:hypothetical protein